MNKFDSFIGKYLKEADPIPGDPTAPPAADPMAAPAADPTAPPADPNAAPPVDPNAPADPNAPGAGMSDEELASLSLDDKIGLVKEMLTDMFMYTSAELTRTADKAFLMVRGELKQEEVENLQKLGQKIKLGLTVENSSIGKTKMTKINIENQMSFDEFINGAKEKMKGGPGPGMAPGIVM